MSCRPREERALAREKKRYVVPRILNRLAWSDLPHTGVFRRLQAKKTRAQETMTRDTMRVAFPRVTRFFMHLTDSGNVSFTHLGLLRNEEI